MGWTTLAEHAVRIKFSYKAMVDALKKRFLSLDIEELRILEFHQLMEEVGVNLQKVARKAFQEVVQKSLIGCSKASLTT